MVSLLDLPWIEHVQTDGFMLLQVLSKPIDTIETRLVDRPFPEPAAARKVREEYFMDVCLAETRKYLEQSAIWQGTDKKYVIDNYSEVENKGPLHPLAIGKAVYEVSQGGKSRKNFDGTNAQFRRLVQEGERTIIEIYPMVFSEWMACQTPEFTKAYLDMNLEDEYPEWYQSGLDRWIPYAGIGVSTVVQTSDPTPFFIGTFRGYGTPNLNG